MDDWFCFVQESSPEGEYVHRFRKCGDFCSVSPVPLRPEDSPCGRLRPPSRLKMNSRYSALTAVLAGLRKLISGRRGTVKELALPTTQERPHQGAGKSPFSLDKDLSWMPTIRDTK
jgi:hypothetical protein